MTNQDLHCRNFTTKRSEPVYSNNGKLMIDVGELGLNTTDILTHDKLDLINLDTYNINSKLENFISQTLTIKLDNTLILNTPPGVSSYADSNPSPVMDAFNRDGWLYTNTLAGNKFNYYYFSNTGFTETLSNIKGQYAVFQNDSLTTDNVNVILALYGIDGFAGGPRRVYYSNEKLLPGVKYLVYWGINPDVFPELPRIEYNLVDEINWDENIDVLTMSVGSDSAYTAGTVQNLMTHIGYINSDNEPVITTLINTLDAVNSETQMVELLNVSNSELISVKNNTSDIAINTLGISNDTQSINGKIRNGQQTMTNSIPVVLASNHNDINTRINSVLNVGTHNNINNDTTINFGDYSTSNADISNMRDCNIVYSDSSNSSFDSVGVEVSGNGGINWYEIGGIFPSAPIGGALRLGFSSFSVGGFSLMRISNKSTDTNFNNVQASVFGSP